MFNHHGKHMYITHLCTYMKQMFKVIKENHAMNDILRVSRCFFHIQCVDNIIKGIYDLLDDSTIEEYEMYRESVKVSIIKNIDGWIDGSFI